MVQAWNPSQKNAAINLTGSNLIGTDGTGAGYHPCFAANGVSTGRIYWETTHNYGAASGEVGIGNTSSNTSTGSWLGIDTSSFGWESNGHVWYGFANVATWASFSTGTLIRLCWALDLISNLLFGRVGAAGNWNNGAIGSQNPAVGSQVGGWTVPSSIYASPVVPAFNTFTNGDVCTGCFATSSWVGTPPAGFASFDPSTQAWPRPIVSFFR